MSYVSRIFLNKKQGMAAMQTTMEICTNYVECSFTLSDCNRQVNIDLSSSNVKTLKEKRAKLETIIQQLMLLREQMDEFKESPEFKRVFK